MILGHSGIIKRKELQSSDVLVATRKRGVGVISAQKTQAEITRRKTDTGESGSGTWELPGHCNHPFLPMA